MDLQKILEIYMTELKLGIVRSFEHFKQLHNSPLLRYIKTYAHGMMLVNINSK